MNNITGLREAPLDHKYGFTINVSPNKCIGSFSLWGKLNEQEQKNLLKGAIDKYFDALNMDAPYYEFELTKQGMVHVHGVIECTEVQVKDFQAYICKKFAFPRLDPKICFLYERTKVDKQYWEQYMRKAFEEPKSPTDYFMFS